MTLAEPVTPDSQWRKQSRYGVMSRAQLVLESMARNLPLENLSKILIVTPLCEVEQITLIAAPLFSTQNLSVISETEICPELPDGLPGWYIQQLLKLAVADHLDSTHYLTMDSDIICTRAFKVEALFPDGKALMNVETIEDYLGLYTDEYARSEVTTKVRRYQASANLLGYRRSVTEHPYFFGETPVILEKAGVQSLKAHLENRHSQSWLHILANSQGWTEYGLYFQFLESTGQLLPSYEPASCNTLLDLYHSVWQASEWYRKPRVYDGEHFRAHEMTGYFIAIQSWLDHRYWLPPGYAGVDEFYVDLKKFLGF